MMMTGCNKSKGNIHVKESGKDNIKYQGKDSIRYTVEFLNSLEWTSEEIQHLDSLTDNLVCRNSERDLDTIINHIKVKFITDE